ncbi:MAG: restriction endonuclease [Arthrobacter sp.]|nr:restriction endonuclease [Arthrobacter sp.]
MPQVARCDKIRCMTPYAQQMDWNDYQERVAAFFRVLGLEAETNVALSGARGVHDIDVIVRSTHGGMNLLWLVECKLWKRRVSKLHVLGLQKIVEDIGADRGLLLSESGFQSGARSAAMNSNLLLTSLEELRQTTGLAADMVKLAGLGPRIDECERRYWSHSKEMRIAYELRGHYSKDIYGIKTFHGAWVIDAARDAYAAAIAERLPVDSNGILVFPELRNIRSLPDLVNWLQQKVLDLEERLDAAEAVMKHRGDYNPLPGPSPREFLKLLQVGSIPGLVDSSTDMGVDALRGPLQDN